MPPFPATPDIPPRPGVDPGAAGGTVGADPPPAAIRSSRRTLRQRLADLGVGRKLLLICLLDLCTVVFISGILIHEKYLAIDFSRKELQGAAYIDALRPTLIELARTPDPRRDVDADADAALARIDRAEQAHGHGLGSGEPALQFARALRALPAANDTADERRARRLAALDRGRALVTRIGNQSNLILDPDLDSYYTMSLILLRYPALASVVSQTTPTLLAASGGRSLDADARNRLYVLEGELRAIGESIASDHLEATTASGPMLRQRTAPSSGALDAALVRYARVVRAVAAGGPSDLADAAPAATALLDALDTAWAVGDVELRRLIDARIDGYFMRMWLHLGAAAALLLTILLAVYVVAQRIARPLKALSEVVDTVRRTGDHTLRAQGSSRDEIGRLAKGFNEMLARLDAQRQVQQELAASARAAEAQQRLVERMPVPLMVTSVPDHRVLHANPPAREWLGDGVTTDPWAGGITAEQRRRFFQQLADQEIVGEFEVRWQRGGQADWAVLSARRLDFQGQDAVVTSFTPIGRIKALEQRLELWAKVFETSSEGIALLDAGGRVLSANRAIGKALGMDPIELAHQPLDFVIVGDSPLAGSTEPWSLAARRGGWRGEVQVRRRDGIAFPAWAVLTAVRHSAGTLLHHIFTCVDITERKANEEQVRFLAHHDLLTGLPNRGMAERRLSEAMQQSIEEGHQLAVLFIDLDRFKVVNDSLGHQAGDALLKQAAQRLRLSVREVDTVSRFGGDEFVVLLNGVSDGDEALQIAQRLRAAMRTPFSFEGVGMNVSASIGIAMFPDDAAGLDELMRHADSAMYQAKAAGRDSVYFFTRELNDRARQRLRAEVLLRTAVARDELALVFQPQVAAVGGAPLAVEALLRWTSPELGPVSPAQFIPLAEETRTIVPIGAWVIDAACRQLAEWRRRGIGIGVVSVNLSAVQLEDDGLLQAIAAALARHAVDPAALELELTESTLMVHTDERLARLHALKALGVGLSIDDFGTGYSSLSYLSRLPMGKLKIDRSLVKDLLVEPKDRAIAEAVIALAHRLEMTVVAEGVETAEVLEALATAGCDAIQGFHTGRPMPAEALERWLSKRRGSGAVAPRPGGGARLARAETVSPG